MPELPEVATIVNSLRESVLSKTISEVDVLDSRVIKEPSPDAFKKILGGRSVIDIQRRGKAIIISLSGGWSLLVHLRMTGWVLYGKRSANARVVLRLSKTDWLNYIDQRCFGELRLRRSFQELDFFKRLGPEPFDMKSDDFYALCAKRKTAIKVLLLDQHAIAGIGNIYAQEALFSSGIDPRRQACSLSHNESDRLLRAVVAVFNEALLHKGSSIDTYRTPAGNTGGMELRLKVYDHDGQPCPRCGALLVKIALSGRGTCFCPRCQK